MAKLTGALTSLTTTWVKIVDSGETFMLTVLGGTIFLNWKSTSPAASDFGHKFVDGDTFGDSATTENVWVRADITASLIVTKE